MEGTAMIFFNLPYLNHLISLESHFNIISYVETEYYVYNAMCVYISIWYEMNGTIVLLCSLLITFLHLFFIHPSLVRLLC